MAVKCNSKKVAKFILWTSIVILIVSTVFLIVFPTIYKNQLKKQITLTEGSVITGLWEDIPLPLYERLYFFNITNGDDFVRGAPLNVSEVGPYTYKGRWVKKYPQWNSNGTVSYRETRTYHFVPEMSVGSQNDEIYTLNGPMAIATNLIKNYPWWLKIIASAALKIKDENLITRKKIRELVYDGYNDIIIKIAPTIKSDIPYKNGRFSWLYGKNATDDGVFTVFTGAENASVTNFINTWNGQERLNFWKGDECNMMNGTTIETGPPIEGYQETYTFFQSIFCRSLTFNYTRDVTHYGILTKRFESTYEIFANGSENPNNYCFDVQPGLASGVLDVSSCQFGAPVLISFPHFYMGDPSYLQGINGLDPNAEKHNSYMDVDPVTGMSLYLNVNFQVNVQLQKVKGIFQLDDIQEGIYPIFWAGLSLEIDQDMADFYYKNVKRPEIIGYGVLSAVIFFCVIGIIVSLIILRKGKGDLPLINEEEKSSESKIQKQIYKSSKHSDYGSQGISKYDEAGETVSSAIEEENKALDLSPDDSALPINNP